MERSRLISNTFLLFVLLADSSSLTMGLTHRVKPLATHEELNPDGLHTYIVRVRRNPSISTSEHRESWYKSFLPVQTASLSQPRLIYAYSSVISGFAARLTEKELMDMKNKTGFVHAFPDRLVPLQTTHTPSFLGLHKETPGFWPDSNFGKGVIIGVLDTGILPNHPSFSDKGIPPPPAKWTGTCEFNASDCNNKLIGARNFVQGLQAMGLRTRVGLQGPYDQEGHGTHTAGTAAGAFVDFANVNGQANGTAVGIAPNAHLAIYKVCGKKGCADSDILAGLDSAVGDGVDVLSLSLGGGSFPFYNDSVAIGTFGAIEKGVFVSCAAGNNGPSHSTLSNEAPWILSVGASTVDRVIRTTVTLGNGEELNGESLYQPRSFRSNQLPLIYPGLLGDTGASLCANGSLDGVNVKGMVVVCDEGDIASEEKGLNVKNAGGAAVIIANVQDEGFTISAGAHVLPASQVSYSDGLTIKAYIKSVSAPTASITFKGTLTGISPAPVVGYFSSRGPNQADPNILKPDIIGPGVNVLAAWPFKIGTSIAASPFNIISGTSMATPHLSGIAALLKSAHPDWSPAAIKSAIMTSADLTANDGNLIRDQTLNTADFFAVGSGHVNPSRANNPGMIYDIMPDNYISYLCGLQYTNKQVSAVARRPIKCSDITSISGAELNYPSFMVFLSAATSYPSFMVFLSAATSYAVQVTRTVTNVGASSSAYTAQISPPSGASEIVKPTQIVFSKANEKVQFSITFTGNSSGSRTVSYSQGDLTWVSSDQSIIVNSPIMVAVG